MLVIGVVVFGADVALELRIRNETRLIPCSLQIECAKSLLVSILVA